MVHYNAKDAEALEKAWKYGGYYKGKYIPKSPYASLGNEVAAAIGVPIVLTSPVTWAVIEGAASTGKAGFNLMDKFATKIGTSKAAQTVMKGLDLMTPGTSQFMNLWNSGAWGKLAGTVITGLNAKWMHDAYKAAAADPSAENVAMAALSSAPFMNGFGNMAGKGLDLVSKASKPFRDFRLALNMRVPQLIDDAGSATRKALNLIVQPGKKAYKWWNADKRIRNTHQKAFELWRSRLE
jgi:hypothetical protein